MAKRSYHSLPNLRKSRRHAHTSWAEDWDYISRLSPQERAWLDEFAREYYRSGSRRLQPIEAARERWRAFKAGARDVMSRGDGVGKRLKGDDGAKHLESDGARSGSEVEDLMIEGLDRKRRRGT